MMFTITQQILNKNLQQYFNLAHDLAKLQFNKYTWRTKLEKSH